MGYIKVDNWTHDLDNERRPQTLFGAVLQLDVLNRQLPTMRPICELENSTFLPQDVSEIVLEILTRAISAQNFGS